MHVYHNDSISIHTALAGCDVSYRYGVGCFGAFQSTQPSQAVTFSMSIPSDSTRISIHTALAGCDYRNLIGFEEDENFNPHSPRRL